MAATTKTFEPGDHLFNEGDRPECILIINKGAVAIRKRRGASQVELARVKAGEVLGEMSFFDRQPRSASAVALVRTEALVVSFEALDKIYASVPNYFRTIMASVVERLRRADESIRTLEKRTIEEKDGVEADSVDAAAIEAENLAMDQKRDKK